MNNKIGLIIFIILLILLFTKKVENFYSILDTYHDNSMTDHPSFYYYLRPIRYRSRWSPYKHIYHVYGPNLPLGRYRFPKDRIEYDTLWHNKNLL